MKFLIFEPQSTGHHFEYVKHELDYAIGSEDSFVFVLANGFRDKLHDFYDKPLTDNITLYFLTDEESEFVRIPSIMTRSRKLALLLRGYYRRISPDKIILNQLVLHIPYLLLYFTKKNLIRGIVYKIPRHRDCSTMMGRIKDNLFYWLVSSCRAIDKIWLLNDEESAIYYNNFYRSSKFESLADPIYVTETLNPDILDRYKDTHKIILFHGGGMGERKGTLDIIDALKAMSEDRLKNFILILGGKLSDNAEYKIVNEFVDSYGEKMEIEFPNSFISFEDLCSYIKVADYVLIPYKNVEQSSGILGYSAYYNKKVVGPAGGLLGHLITTYNLGLVLSSSGSNGLADVFSRIVKPDSSQSVNTKYVEMNSIENFVNTLFEH